SRTLDASPPRPVSTPRPHRRLRASPARSSPGGLLVLLDGFNHVATLTNDSARLQGFYEEVFDAKVVRDGPETPDNATVRMTVIRIGPHSELNVFEVDGNTEADRQTPMFGRG